MMAYIGVQKHGIENKFLSKVEKTVSTFKEEVSKSNLIIFVTELLRRIYYFKIPHFRCY